MKKLYVGNLPFSASEEDVQNWFTEAGFTPSRVTLLRDRATGQLRGFGFVEFNGDEDGERAMQALNGQNLMGRKVIVNEARPQAEGGGGRGRGGFGRGRGHGGGYRDRDRDY